jgi:hypothetical protein
VSFVLPCPAYTDEGVQYTGNDYFLAYIMVNSAQPGGDGGGGSTHSSLALTLSSIRSKVEVFPLAERAGTLLFLCGQDRSTVAVVQGGRPSWERGTGIFNSGPVR